MYGRLIPPRDPRVQQTVLGEPISVCIAFSPWHFPFSQAFRKVAAAVGAGCPVILKGSSDTPGSLLAIAQLFHDAGLPTGVLNVVSGDSGMFLDYLIRSPVDEVLERAKGLPFGMASSGWRRAWSPSTPPADVGGDALRGVKESGYGSEGGSGTTKFVSQIN